MLLGVLGAGMAILAVDKTLLGPSGASAATPFTPPDPPPVAADSAPPPAAPAEPLADLAQRLLRATADLPDMGSDPWAAETLVAALRIGPHWTSAPAAAVEVLSATPDTPAEDPRPVPHDPVAQFRAKHRLTAVASGQGHAVAVINGQPRPVGAVLDGFTLTSIGRDSVILERDGRRVELTVRSAARPGPERISEPGPD